MAISTEISRIQKDKVTIRAKLVALGLANSVDNLDILAEAIDNIIDCGAVDADVKEGESYTIPKGYHNGGGVVKGVVGGGNYKLQEKIVEPTKKQQNVTSDEGFYGLSKVQVQAIPDTYQDVTAVTATAPEVISGKIFVAKDGTVVTGTMADNGKIDASLSAAVISYTIPKGYHNGLGKVTLTLEDKTITPTKEIQNVTASPDMVLGTITVNPIPDEYITTTDSNATANQILVDQTAYVNGVKITGTMPNNGAVNTKLSEINKTYTVPEGYHNGLGSVSVTTETATIVPSKSEQTANPSEGSLLSQVTVSAIPDKYQDVSTVDVTAADMLTGKTAISSTGTAIKGSMPNNGAIKYPFDATKVTTVAIPKGYTDGGSVDLTPDLEEALAAI